MIYTAMIIASVAIIEGAVGLVITPTGAAVESFSGEFNGYLCGDVFNAYINATVYPKLYECLGAGKWATEATALNLSAPTPSDWGPFCCYHYHVMIVEESLYDRHCMIRPPFLRKYRNERLCRESGHNVSDTYCAQRPDNREMSASCDQFVRSLLNGSHILLMASNSTAGSNQSTDNHTCRSSTDSTGRPSTPVSVLLAAIVVSIAGD